MINLNILCRMCSVRGYQFLCHLADVQPFNRILNLFVSGYFPEVLMSRVSGDTGHIRFRSMFNKLAWEMRMHHV